MDTFDVKKYITENRINEKEGYESRYLITFADGTDEEVGKHASVSPEDVIGSLKKKYARRGKEVSDVKHLGEKPQGIYESDMGNAVEFYMDHYGETEMASEVRDAISDALDSGKPLEWVKSQIKNGFLDMVLQEDKDVIDPDKDAVAAEKEEKKNLPVPDEDGNIDDEESEDIPFENNDAFVLKYVSSDTDENIYVPFRAKQAKNNGYNTFDSAVEAVSKYMFQNKDIEYSEEDEVESIIVNVPDWVDSFAVVSKKRNDDLETESSDYVEWVEYVNNAPKDDSGISDWTSHMLKSFDKAKEDNTFLYRLYKS